MAGCSGGLGTGTRYTYAQLEGLWINAGGSKALAPVMAAIAEAESGGCSTAYNPSGATGLWQILGAVSPADQSKLTDPAVNAHEAVLKYQSQGLQAWTTYTSGAYKAYLSGSTTPDTSVPGSSGGAAATLTSDVQASDPSCAFGLNIDLASKIPVVGGLFPANDVCLLHKATIRHIVGGGLIVWATVPAGLAVILLGAFAFRATGAASAAASVVSAVPGGGRAAVAARSIGRATSARRAPAPQRAAAAAP